MIFPDRGVLQSFPSILDHRKARIFLTEDTDINVELAIQELIDSRHQLQDRISAPLQGMESDLFAKFQPLDSFKPKLRVTLGLAKRILVIG